jgi:hypothetical protein
MTKPIPDVKELSYLDITIYSNWLSCFLRTKVEELGHRKSIKNICSRHEPDGGRIFADFKTMIEILKEGGETGIAPG